jgi:hypothetical protein
MLLSLALRNSEQQRQQNQSLNLLQQLQQSQQNSIQRTQEQQQSALQGLSASQLRGLDQLQLTQLLSSLRGSASFVAAHAPATDALPLASLPPAISQQLQGLLQEQSSVSLQTGQDLDLRYSSIGPPGQFLDGHRARGRPATLTGILSAQPFPGVMMQGNSDDSSRGSGSSIEGGQNERFQKSKKRRRKNL